MNSGAKSARHKVDVVEPFHTNRRSLTSFGMKTFSSLASLAKSEI
jgi:hypothetical protein